MFTEISCTKLTGSKERGLTLINNTINELMYTLNRWSLDPLDVEVEVVVKFKEKRPLVIRGKINDLCFGWYEAIEKYDGESQ